MGVILIHKRLARAAVNAQRGLHVAGDDIKVWARLVTAEGIIHVERMYISEFNLILLILCVLEQIVIFSKVVIALVHFLKRSSVIFHSGLLTSKLNLSLLYSMVPHLL